MKLFEHVDAKTHSRRRRGNFTKRKPSEEIKKAFFGGEVLVPMTQELAHSDVAMEWDDITPDLFLPCQVDRSFALTPEQQLCHNLIWDSLEQLQYTYQGKLPCNSSFKRLKPEKEREDILAWIDGADAKLPFESIVDSLKMDLVAVRRAVKIACESWDKSNGILPDLSASPHRNYVPRGEEGEKPPPTFTERYLEYQKTAKRFKAGIEERKVLEEIERKKKVVLQRTIPCPHGSGTTKSKCKACVAARDHLYWIRLTENKPPQHKLCPHGKFKYGKPQCQECYITAERARGARDRAKRREANPNYKVRFKKCLHGNWHTKCQLCKNTMPISEPFVNVSNIQELI